MIRPARLDDLPRLLDIEARCFPGDRLSRRGFRHLLTRANARTLIAEAGGEAVGYAAVLFHRGNYVARLYSIALLDEARSRGRGRALIEAAMEAARDGDCAAMRLETRVDNYPAQKLFKAAGFRIFGRHPNYYEDGTDAYRLERSLADVPTEADLPVPYFQQTLDFTCGPAALMMAMGAVDPGIPFDRAEELNLWREATTIFMTAGHGGCSPFGLALAAWDRGFAVEVFANDGGSLFIDSVRGKTKKDVVRLVQEGQIAGLAERGIPLHRGIVGVAAIEERVRAGEIPIVLISVWRIAGQKQPHWVTVTDVDEHFVYVNDPMVYKGRSREDSIRMPIARAEFERMARFGRGNQKAVVLLKGRRRGGVSKPREAV